jgi:hypothetical protein
LIHYGIAARLVAAFLNLAAMPIFARVNQHIKRKEPIMPDLKKEEEYWREHHSEQPYAKKEFSFEHYAPAYRAGAEAVQKYPGKSFEEIEDDVALDYQRHRVGAALPWDHARHAVHAAWAKLSHDIGPRDADRGVRYGL